MVMGDLELVYYGSVEKYFRLLIIKNIYGSPDIIISVFSVLQNLITILDFNNCAKS